MISELASDVMVRLEDNPFLILDLGESIIASIVHSRSMEEFCVPFSLLKPLNS